MNTPARFGIVGAGGWRARFFGSVAAQLPDQLELVGVVSRRAERAAAFAAQWGGSTYATAEELVAHEHPAFVISSVPWPVNPDVVMRLVEAGTRVLSETPPAPDLQGLRRLWRALGNRTADVQVAEQNPRLPGHAARRAIVDSGAIGTPTSVQVSSTHGYHAVALMRHLLRSRDMPPAVVRAWRFTAPLVDPLTRVGWTDDDAPKPADTVLASVDLGDGRSGLYDFTDNQWHNQLRFRRIVVRGSHGELADDDVVSLTGPRSIVRSTLIRSQLGHDLNLDGHDTEHFSYNGHIVWRNKFLGLRLMDDEIAVADLMGAMADWVRDQGPPPYPLAQGSFDHSVSLAIDAAASSGETQTVDPEPWTTIGRPG